MENWTIEVIWNGPLVRQVTALKNGAVVEKTYSADGLVTEPCNPRCTNSTSMCCWLHKQTIEVGLSGPARTLYRAIASTIQHTGTN